MAERTLYDKNNREIKFNIVFGAVASAILLFLAIIVSVNNFLFMKVYVNGGSMKPTLQSGDIVMVNVYRAPSYGDVIVISGEKENGDWLIKRAIAFGGDTVKIGGGYVYLKKSGESEFKELDEKYLSAEGITYYPDCTDPHDTSETIFDIEDGRVFYLGDNRTNSSDSRSAYGTCDKSQIVGVVSEFAIKIRGVNKFFDNLVSPLRNLFGTSC